MHRFDVDEVKRYYEHNTSLLLKLGQGVDGTIRRAVWAPGVERRADAMAYVDDLILEQVERLADHLGRPPHVLDLGCGVAASLCRIAQRCAIVGTGVTISPSQVKLAEEQLRELGLAESLRVLEADYCRLPSEVEDFDLAFAIESFVHAPRATRFFESAFAALRPGGLLVVCDDFMATDPAELAPRAARWVRRYCNGWRVSSLLGPSELDEVAKNAGFSPEMNRDLSSFVELGRPRDFAIALLVRGLSWLPLGGSYWSMLKGGDALQRCLKSGWVSYRFCSFRKPESD